MIWSMTLSALRRPSRMCSRSRALSRRNCERRVMTSTWWRDVALQRRDEVERARHAVDQRDHVDAEAGLQLGELVEVVEHDVGVGVALQRDDQAGLATGGAVVDVGDAVEVAAVDQLLDAPGDGRAAGLVRQLGDHDL